MRRRWNFPLKDGVAWLNRKKLLLHPFSTSTHYAVPSHCSSFKSLNSTHDWSNNQQQELSDWKPKQRGQGTVVWEGNDPPKHHANAYLPSISQMKIVRSFYLHYEAKESSSDRDEFNVRSCQSQGSWERRIWFRVTYMHSWMQSSNRIKGFW